MSEMTTVDVEFKDEELLIDTLKLMGYNPTLHKNGTEIDTYYAGKVKPKAHIVIDKKQFGGYASAGFERDKNGFKLHIDTMDKQKFGIKKLKGSYLESKVMKFLKKSSKYSLKSRIEEKDKIRIKARVNY
jgi:hypothetical protein